MCVYVSPYLRAYQTLEALDLGSLVERVIEEPRLREQDWANFQIAGDIEDQKELRNAYGHFFYRFREGESGSDVYDRISSFMETLYRHWSRPDYAPNTLFVTHGLTMRLFCMRWFHWSVEYFESLNNPDNAEVRTLLRTAARQVRARQAVQPVGGPPRGRDRSGRPADVLLVDGLEPHDAADNHRQEQDLQGRDGLRAGRHRIHDGQHRADPHPRRRTTSPGEAPAWHRPAPACLPSGPR